MPKTALFNIDIQDELALDPKTRVPDASRVLDAGNALLERARSYIDKARSNEETPDLRIVVVQHEDLTPEEGTLLKGTKAWQLAFPPRDGDKNEVLIGKTDGDTFESNPDLAAQLKADGVSTIVAFGLQSENCVRSTSIGALNAGFNVIVLQGAHSTYDDNGKKAVEIEKDVEEELKGLGAKLMPWQDWYP